MPQGHFNDILCQFLAQNPTKFPLPFSLSLSQLSLSFHGVLSQKFLLRWEFRRLRSFFQSLRICGVGKKEKQSQQMKSLQLFKKHFTHLKIKSDFLSHCIRLRFLPSFFLWLLAENSIHSPRSVLHVVGRVRGHARLAIPFHHGPSVPGGKSEWTFYLVTNLIRSVKGKLIEKDDIHRTKNCFSLKTRPKIRGNLSTRDSRPALPFYGFVHTPSGPFVWCEATQSAVDDASAAVVILRVLLQLLRVVEGLALMQKVPTLCRGNSGQNAKNGEKKQQKHPRQSWSRRRQLEKRNGSFEF